MASGWLRAIAAWLVFFGVSALAAPTTASAHIRTGVLAVDCRASVFPLRASLRRAPAARVYKSDQALELSVRPGHTVVVLGYTGEPFLLINGAGVAVNASSPTAAAAGLLKRSDPVPVRGWHLRSSRRTAIWHDARVRGLPPGVQRRGWAVPLVVDGRRVRLGGEVWRVAARSPSPSLGLGVPFMALVVFLLARRRSVVRPAAVALGVAAAAGTVGTAAAFALAASASSGRWVEGANEFVFVLVGLALVARGSAEARCIAGGALGLFRLSVGLSKVPVFLHGVVLSSSAVGDSAVGDVRDFGAADGRRLGRVRRSARAERRIPACARSVGGSAGAADAGESSRV